MTSRSRILTPGILLGTIISAIIVLTASADPTNCTPPPSGLVGWWRGDGDCLDAAGTNNGTFQGGATFALGEVGEAFSFNPVSGTMIVPDSSNLRLTNQLTIEAWINARSIGDPDGYGLVSKVGGAGGTGTANFGYQFGLSGNALFGQFSSPGDSWWQWPSARVTSGGLIAPGVWYHVAWTYDQSAMKLYCNGQPVATNVIGPKVISATSSNLRLSGDDNGHVYFDGLIDEAAVYNRALTDSEIQAIYSAGSVGKCVTPVAPSIYQQPSSQVVTVGANVSFSVGASGTAPLAYQWQFNGTNLGGAVTSTLSLTNVQNYDGGSYTVVVTNAYGSVVSSNAVLTANPAPPCAPPPAGLIGWWPGEGTANDIVGANNGTLLNGVTFAPGNVGQAFAFNGANSYVQVSNNPNLNPTGSFSIEAWVCPRQDAAAALVSKWGDTGELENQRSYNLFILPGRALQFAISDWAHQWDASFQLFNTAPGAITLQAWNYIVAVYDQSTGTRLIYVNGVQVASRTDAPITVTNGVAPLTLGAWVNGGSLVQSDFDGLLDEVSLYNRALSAGEVAAIYAAGVSGKCALPPSAPYIYAQPANQVTTVGGSVTFSLAVGGTPPLSYQWSFGGSAIDGATNASLTLTNVQSNQAGNYSVVITNAQGTASSSNATLSVNFPPASVRVVSVTNAQSGVAVIVPVALTANGNENGLSFSLNFDTSKLTYVSTVLGSGASGANLLTNAAQAASGKLGVILALPPNQTFAAGTQELVEVTFMTAVRTIAFSTTVSFGDIPIVRELSDAPGNVLAAAYASGSVLIQAANFEGDLSPRPNGDKAVTVTDWVLAGRYAARLDYPTNAAEFQRADCAPRATLGDGAITVIDWVQVGLYAAGLDPLTVAGGPTSEVIPGGIISGKGSGANTPHGDPPSSRRLEVADTMVLRGLTGTASVQLEAMGNENALGFSLGFDPAAVTYVGASIGSASNGVTLIVNDTQAGAGRLGFVLGFGAGKSFVSGTRELVKVTFRAATPDQGKCMVSFSDLPVPCEVSGTNALPMGAGYVTGTITVNPLPSLSIGRTGADITLAWPLWATNFGLQAAEGGLPPTVPWTNLAVVPTLTSNQALVTLPLAATNKVYRLHQP